MNTFSICIVYSQKIGPDFPRVVAVLCRDLWTGQSLVIIKLQDECFWEHVFKFVDCYCFSVCYVFIYLFIYSFIRLRDFHFQQRKFMIPHGKTFNLDLRWKLLPITML